MGKNYLDHDEKVRYIEGLLNKSTDWGWFVSCLEENYEFLEFNSWKFIIKNFHETRELYQKFIKILEIENVELKFSNQIFNEIYMVSKFYLGKINKMELINNIQNNYSKVLFLFVWITKLENECNSNEYVLDMQLFNYYNMYKLINVDTIKEHSSEISEYIEILKLKDFSEALECFWDNINEIEHNADPNFLDKNKKKIYCCNTFNYNRIEIPENATWEEKYLCDMLAIKIVDKSLNPSMVLSESTYPDINSWTEDVINQMKNFFHDEISAFILETLSYILYKNEPSETVINKHLKLLLDALNKKEKYLFDSSSFEIFTCLFHDKIIRKMLDQSFFRSFINKLNMIQELNEIVILNNLKIPLSKKQQLKIREYFTIQSNSISEASNVNELSELFENKDVIKEMKNKNFLIAINKFNEYIFNYDFMTPTLFYSYMNFLIRLRKNNMYVDKSVVDLEIIRIQQLWSTEYYEKCLGDLHVHSSSFEIPSEIIEGYNETVLYNIFNLSKQCILSSQQDFIKTMEIASENIIYYLTTRMNIDRIFPYKEIDTIDYRRRDIEKLIKGNIKAVLSTHGYRFLNRLDDDIYVKIIINQCKQNIILYAGMFHNEKKLYEIISNKIEEIDLLEFDDNISLAHLTQFFPVLEMKIRKFATLINKVPFKESKNTFIQYKDPSSILRDLLKEIHEETDSFEKVEDILFIYFFMYSSSSLNIRNECIHGRDYISGNCLKFGFKITMFSLYMIISRIELIENNLKKESL